ANPRGDDARHCQAAPGKLRLSGRNCRGRRHGRAPAGAVARAPSGGVMPDLVERRALAGELRADAQGKKLVGYAARFGVPASIGGAFTETIRAGAFRSTLAAKGDVLALVDHASDRLLARTKSGTLRLSEDAQGLAFSLD